jgi:hypothetical protein
MAKAETTMEALLYFCHLSELPSSSYLDLCNYSSISVHGEDLREA